MELKTSSSGHAAYRKGPPDHSGLLRLVVIVPFLLSVSIAIAACTPSASQPVPDADPRIQACAPDVAEAAFDVVKRQQRAFANNEFDSALQFASNGFRSSVTPPQFKALIVSDYSFLLSNSNLRLTECSPEGTGVVLRVVVGSDFSLEYRMVAEDGPWRIDGASILKEIST